MRFSEITGDRALDVIAEIIEPITNIALDENASDVFQIRKLPEGETMQSFALKRIKRSYPALMGKHKQDLIKILSTIDGVSVKEYEKEITIPKLMTDFAALLTDEYFRTFFMFAPTEKGEN